ncbi:MAG: M23 family metallopeptidase [Candidatus Binatia bacterium]|nr:M23 family metallopeptidase [Candidatus Binatia bacterium]
MKAIKATLFILVFGLVILDSVDCSQVQDRTSRAIEKHYKDGDGAGNAEDAGSGISLEGRTTMDAIDRATVCAIRRGRNCSVKHAIARGLFETGLEPRFPENLKCRGIDHHYAMDYSHKRLIENYHGGIDVPAPFGTPIIAAAAGTVVAKYLADNSPRGVEIVLRHRPEDTGLPFWIYTQYTHFDQMPKQAIGQRVCMGEVLGPTGNSGLHPRKGGQHENRRPAIHFAVFYSTSELFVERRRYREMIIPVNFQWMDPVALFRKKLPLDSHSMKALPEEEKRVPISIMLDNGQLFPPNTKIIWPYTCRRE